MAVRLRRKGNLVSCAIGLFEIGTVFSDSHCISPFGFTISLEQKTQADCTYLKQLSKKRLRTTVLGRIMNPNSAFRRQHSTCWVVSANANWRYCVTFCAESPDEHEWHSRHICNWWERGCHLDAADAGCGKLSKEQKFFSRNPTLSPTLFSSESQ